MTDPYDWEKPLLLNDSLLSTKSLPTIPVPVMLAKAAVLNQQPTTLNVDTNNQENVEPDNRKELDVRRDNANSAQDRQLLIDL